jgi:hypothetical protein
MISLFIVPLSPTHDTYAAGILQRTRDMGMHYVQDKNAFVGKFIAIKICSKNIFRSEIAHMRAPCMAWVVLLHLAAHI